MTKSIKINGMDSYETWGIFLAKGNISSLMTPPSMKEYISNESALENGTRVVTADAAIPRIAERNVCMELWMKATSWKDYLSKYSSFVSVLQGGTLRIEHDLLPVVYKMLYVSCVEFYQYDGRLSKFVLTLREPVPSIAKEYEV